MGFTFGASPFVVGAVTSKFATNERIMEIQNLRAAENVIRVLPPLNVKKGEIDLALKIIKKVCKEYK